MSSENRVSLVREVMSRVLLVLVSTTVSLGLAELMYRWYAEREFKQESKIVGNMIPVRGAQVFALKPSTSGDAPAGDEKHTFPFSTNAYGLRDRDRPAKAPGTKRVLVMGDSYTWGYAILGEEAYPQVAERMLAERGRPDIEVINGSVPDYGSRQERRLLEQLIPIYKPDAVFLGYVVNDAEPPTSMPAAPEEVFRHARSWFLTAAADRLNRRVLRRQLFPSAKVTVGSNYLDGFDETSLKWRDSREAIREMRDLSAAAGSAFIVLMLPDFTQALDERYGLLKIHDAVASWGRELNFPVLDVLPLFRGEDNAKLIVPWDGHPNAEAHRRIAAFLVGKIIEEPTVAR